MSSEGDDFGGAGAGGAGTGEDGPVAAAPAKAQAAAQLQQVASVTLVRALATCLHMVEDVRGFKVTKVAGGVPVRTREEALQGVQVYACPKRVAKAEAACELLLLGEVQDGPPEGTTAWALGIPPGSKLAVVTVPCPNMEHVRAVEAMQEAKKIEYVIILAGEKLTVYAANYVQGPGAESKPRPKAVAGDTGGTGTGTGGDGDGEHHASAPAPDHPKLQTFVLADLQAPIDTNCMTPKHVPLNAACAARVQAAYGPCKFYRLLTTDPMVRFLGMPAGTMIATFECYGRGQPEVKYNVVGET